MTPPSANGAPQALAIGRKHFLTVFGKPAEVGMKLGESSATLRHTPLQDATEIIRERNEKSL